MFLIELSCCLDVGFFIASHLSVLILELLHVRFEAHDKGRLWVLGSVLFM